MLNPQVQKKYDLYSRLMEVFWYGNLISIAIHYFIGVNVIKGLTSNVPSDNLIMYVLFVIGIPGAIAGVVLSKVLFSSVRFFERFAGRYNYKFDLGNDGDFNEHDKKILIILNSAFSFYVICLGLVNTCSVFGLVASILYHDIQVFYRFALVSGICALLCRPKLNLLVEKVGEGRM
jgi:hypothetical protein